MSVTAYYKGHLIEYDGATWTFCDTHSPVSEGVDRACVFCGRESTKDGHDGCLRTLPEDIVKNACCGHGIIDEAYIQYQDGSLIYGQEALVEQSKLKRKGS